MGNAVADSYPSVTEILRPFFDATYGALQPDEDNEYMRRGRYVGDAMDILVSGLELHPDWLAWFNRHEKWVPFLEAGRKYLAENLPTERPVCQLRLFDKLQRVKGKPDWIWVGQGKITDVKTGSAQPPDWLGMQTGEYAVLSDIHFNRRFYQREILWLRDDGDYRVIPHENPHDALDFNSLLRAHWVLKARL